MIENARPGPSSVFVWTSSSESPTRVVFPSVGSFIAGGLAGAASRTVTSPLERLKILLQIEGSDGQFKRRGIYSNLKEMYRAEGFIRGFFRGNGMNVLRIAPHSAMCVTHSLCGRTLIPLQTICDFRVSVIAFSAVNIVSSGLWSDSWSHGGRHDLSAGLDTVSVEYSGSKAARIRVGGRIGQGCTSRIHSHYIPTLLTYSSVVSWTQNDGFVGMSLKIIREEGGLKGLYRGLTPTALGVGPYVAGNFAFYGRQRSEGIRWQN